ncbi:hypothetical protein Tco_0943715 [Tanacetum coccineum]
MSNSWYSQICINWILLLNCFDINDHDSLNSQQVETFLDKASRNVLKIIRASPRVRQTRAKAVVCLGKIRTLSTQAVSSDVAELKDYCFRALLLVQREQASARSAPVKSS